MLPIIDLSPLRPMKVDISVFQEEETKRIANSFCDALQTYGFLYISGHGIDEQIISNAFKSSKKFFGAENHAIHKQFYRRKGVLCGYVDGINEKDVHGVPMDIKQGYDFVVDSPAFRAIPEQERKSLQYLFEQFQMLSLFMQRFLTVCLDIEDVDYFVKAHRKMGNVSENTTTMRVLHYQPLTEEKLENQSRLSEHTDFGTFTMLFQDDNKGLQVLSPFENKYVDAIPIKGTMVFNVGDLLQTWSQRQLKSTLHRVIIPDELRLQQKSRQSIIFFSNPDNETIISGIDKNGNFEKKSVEAHVKEKNDYSIFDVDDKTLIS